ncbi:MAG: PorV/PorQ family protein, partial [bacterium]
MKKLIFILSAVVMIAQTNISFAQGRSSSGVLFLLIAPGARPGGMGESFVSIADDATATYWNPAGMAFQNRRQVSLMHSNWLPQLAPDFYFDHAAIVQPMEGIGSLGLSLTFLNRGEQVITGEESSKPLGTFSSYDLAAAGSYANKLSENSAIGITLKFIYSNLAPQGAGAEKGNGRATAFAADLG